MYYIRRTISRRQGSSIDEPQQEIPDGGQNYVAPATPDTSTATSSSLSTASTISFPLVSPSPLFPTLHVCTPQPSDPSITLRLHSRARAANHTPAFYGGDNICGDVIVKFLPKDVQHVVSVDVELQGETLVVGTSKPNRFLSRKVNVWSSGDSIGPRLSSSSSLPYLKGHKSFSETLQTTPNQDRDSDVRSISSNSGSPPSSFNAARAASTLGRSLSSASSLFASIGRSQSIIQKEGPDLGGKRLSFRRNAPRRQLEAERTYVWPFELMLPQRIFSSRQSKRESIVPPIPSLVSKTTPTSKVCQDESSRADQEEKGGVRAEMTGYGVGWNDAPFKLVNPFQGSPSGGGETPRPTVTDEGPKNASSPSRLDPDIPLDEDKYLDSFPETLVDDKRTFQLPPSFSESASPAYLEYRIVVTVKMRGAFRDNTGLQKLLLVHSRSYADPVPRSRALSIRANTDSYPLPGPEEHPEGWKLMPQIVMQVQPKGYRSGRIKMIGSTNMDVRLKLAIARPLSYARGMSLPFRLAISIPQLATQTRTNKYKSRPSTSPPTSFPGSLSAFPSPAFALSVTPTSYKFPYTNPSTSAPEDKSVRSKTPEVMMRSEATNSVSSVPSAAAIASSIKLVRAIYVGEGATDNDPRDSSASFVSPVSKAIIFENPDGRGKNDSPSSAAKGSNAKSEANESDSEGWTPERGRLVKTFSGEIPLNEDLKSSFVFPRFVLRYAVVLYPFETPAFTPLSFEPLWSETVTITTEPARCDSVSGNTSRAVSLSGARPPVMSEKNHRALDALAPELKARDGSTEPKQQGDWQNALGTLSTSHVVAVGFSARGFGG